MTQSLASDFPIDPVTTSGTALADILNRFADSVNTSNSGATPPPDTFPGMLWLDTSVTPPVMRIRNAANTGWNTIPISGGAGGTPFLLPDGTVAAPGLAWASEPGLGWFRKSAGIQGFATAGQTIEELGSDGGGSAISLYPRANGQAVLRLFNQASGAANSNYLVVVQGPAGSSGISTATTGSAARGNLQLDAPAVTVTGNMALTGGGQTIMQAGALVGGGPASEVDIYPAASYLTGFPAFPTTNGGLVAVRGNTNSSYATSGAVSCYSGVGNVGMSLLPGANSWTAISDERLKNIESEITDGLEAVLAMRPIRYRFKFEDDTAPVRVGLTAQSVQLNVPEAVDEVSDIGPDGKPADEKHLSLKITETIPHLINAIHTLNARVAQLETA